MPARRHALAVVATAVAVAAPLVPSTAQATPAQAQAADQVLAWFDTTAAAVAKAGSPVQAPSSALWATTWRAADRAVTAQRGSSPYDVAALAGAAHDVLAALVPTDTPDLDRQLKASLNTLPVDPARDRALQTGEAAARQVLTERSGDGLRVSDVQQPYTPPVGPGLWATTTKGVAALQAGLPSATPYLLDSVATFEVPAPPALGTEAYRKDLTEVRAYGRKDSTVRTVEQTAVARFWEASSLSVYTQLLRAAVTELPDLRRRTHLVAVFHEATTDAQIAVYRQKYRYVHWRPLTAIAEADLDGHSLDDGDPTTSPDPTWQPLITTPVHPEYPSGHTGYAAAATVVLERLVGEPASPVSATSAKSGTTRSYTSWQQVLQENLDARVWEGVHFRTSDNVGADLGRRVAEAGLAR